MTPPPLEDRLEDLAAGVHAPPTPDARAAVGRRTRVLRRRRRAVAGGTGALVIAAVVGAIAVVRGPAPDDATTVASEPGRDLPAIVIELDGWEVTTAENTLADAASATGDGSVQTFRTPEGADGPSIVLSHLGASDALGPPTGGEETVTVGDAAGLLSGDADGGIVLQWQHPGVDAVARIEATGLSVGEVVAFAEGLEAKDDEIGYPAEPGDTFGFGQTATVRDLVEVPTSVSGEGATGRHVIQSDGVAYADLTIDEVGPGGIEAVVADPALVGIVQDVTVMGRPGFLIPGPDDLQWVVAWQPSEETVAHMDVQGVDRAGTDALIGALRTISEDDWDALVRGHPPT